MKKSVVIVRVNGKFRFEFIEDGVLVGILEHTKVTKLMLDKADEFLARD